MKSGIEVIEEVIFRILLPGIGVGKHSFGTGFSYLLAEPGEADLFRITEILRHIGSAGVTFIDRLVGRIKIIKGSISKILLRFPVVTIQDNDILQQLVVKTDQFLFQQFHPSAKAESYGQFSVTVDRIDTVIAGTHKEDKKGGTGHVIRIPVIVISAFFHEVSSSLGMFAQGNVLVLYPGKRSDQLFRGVPDNAIDIDQALVGVIDDAADFRIGLSYSEEEGTATDKRFYIRIHLSEVFR